MSSVVIETMRAGRWNGYKKSGNWGCKPAEVCFWMGTPWCGDLQKRELGAAITEFIHLPMVELHGADGLVRGEPRHKCFGLFAQAAVCGEVGVLIDPAGER